MDSFFIEPIARFAGPCAPIRRPREITGFSYDAQHQYQPDDSGITYYYPPRIGSDLSKGFESFNKLDDTRDDHLNNLLDAIIGHEKKLGSNCDVDLVTWRGMMTKILTAPFEAYDGFEMRATRYQGTIYLEEDHDAKLRNHADQHSRPSRPGAASQDMMSYWGYKFEAVSVLARPWTEMSRGDIEARDDLIVSNHAQYVSVVRTGIGRTKMILGGEVDAIFSSKPETPDEQIPWVELKTSAVIRGERDANKYERKLLKFWAQSFLLGIPTIIVGFRDDRGILKDLEEVDTQSIPSVVHNSRNRSWDGNVCINFAAAFLDWLKTIIIDDSTYQISRKPRSSEVTISKTAPPVEGDRKREADIISVAFRQWRESIQLKPTEPSEGSSS